MLPRPARWLLVCLVGVLAACAPEATPLPAFIPTVPTDLPTTASPAPIRYAILPESVGFVPDINRIAALADVTELTEALTDDALDARYDLVAGYGERAGWQLSPTRLHVTLVVNTTLPPLDQPNIAQILRQSVNPESVIAGLGFVGAQPETIIEVSRAELRGALANAGFPDGFDVAFAHDMVPGVARVAELLRALAVAPQTTLRAEDDPAAMEQFHLLLVGWTAPETRQAWVERAGDSNVIDLYSLPISYRAAEGLRVTFAPGGFPLPE